MRKCNLFLRKTDKLLATFSHAGNATVAVALIAWA